MKHGILMHEPGDDVGVAVLDLKVDDEIGVVTLEGEAVGSVKIVDDIPLGHKVAIRDLPTDKQVIEYGYTIGRAIQTVAKGAHVHVHNLKSLRW